MTDTRTSASAEIYRLRSFPARLTIDQAKRLCLAFTQEAVARKSCGKSVMLYAFVVRTLENEVGRREHNAGGEIPIEPTTAILPLSAFSDLELSQALVDAMKFTAADFAPEFKTLLTEIRDLVVRETAARLRLSNRANLGEYAKT